MGEMRKDRPGYQYWRRSDGTIAHYWNPKRACKRAPDGLPVRPIRDVTTDAEIAARCRAWTDELLADLEGLVRKPVYKGTISSLILLYRTGAESPFKDLKHSTRIRDYEPALRLIDQTVGNRAIANLKGDDFRRWYKEWGSKGRTRRAHGAIRKLRAILSYGVQQRLAGCSAVREILHLMTFDAPAKRQVKMEYVHAKAICDQAIKADRPSIALTQAIQWDTALRRIHIIGEWLPIDDGETAGIIRGRTKWHGLTVGNISADMILTVPKTSKNKAATRHDLAACPLVQYVLGQIALPTTGPLIVSEVTGLPYRENYYATDWRKVAENAGVPKAVWSMDHGLAQFPKPRW